MSGTNDTVNMLAFRIVLPGMFSTVCFMFTNRTSPFLPLSSQETVQDQHLGLAQVLMKSLLSYWSLGHARPYAPSKSGVPPSSPVPLLCSSPTGLQSQMFLGFFSQCPGPRLGKLCMAQNSYSYRSFCNIIVL